MMRKTLKFVVVGLCLLAAGEALANNEVATDGEEVAQLHDLSNLFTDFCLSTRDLVQQDLRAKGRSQVPSFVSDLLGNAASTSKDISERLNNLVQHPEASLKRMDEALANGQRSFGQRMAEQPLQPSVIYGKAAEYERRAREGVRSFLSNPTRHLKKLDGYLSEQQRALGKRMQESPFEPASFIKKTYEGISQATKSIGEAIRTAPSRLVAVVDETCAAFSQYETEMRQKFEAAKEQLKAQEPRVASMKLEEVECATARRVLSATAACKSLKEQKQKNQENSSGFNQ